MNSHSDNNEINPESPIRHTSAVAVGAFSDGVKSIWVGLILSLTGVYPLFVLLNTLGNPRHMDTVGAWVLVSPALFAGVITVAFGVKEKGFQEKSIRTLGISVFWITIAFLVLPFVASVMYASGIGN